MPNPNPVSGTIVDGAADDLSPPVKVAGIDGSGNVQTLNVGTDGSQAVVGNVASAATDSGNPVKIGGINKTTTPTFTDGQRGDLQIGTRGSLKVQLVDSNGTTGAQVGSPTLDSINPSTYVGIDTRSFNFLLGNSAMERARNNSDNNTAGITASGVTSTQTGADQTNYNWRGLHVVLDMTAVGTGSVTLEIDAKDPVSGKYYALLTGAAVVSNSTNVYKVYPGLTASANAVANDVLPRTWRIKVTANNANATTYTVGAMLIL